MVSSRCVDYQGRKKSQVSSVGSRFLKNLQTIFICYNNISAERSSGPKNARLLFDSFHVGGTHFLRKREGKKKGRRKLAI